MAWAAGASPGADDEPAGGSRFNADMVHPSHDIRPLRRSAAVLLVIGAASAALAGCGSSSSSSKPAYCSDKSALDSSVKGLKTVDVRSNGVGALTTQVQKVQSDAKSLASSAKSDFPDQTSAITSSVNSLSTTAKGLSSPPSAQAVSGVATDVANVGSAFKGFSDAASSKC
ncbi:MAG: hypothetical protein QOK49_605 [Baekduia sp.]|jgi:hypothetical protein|nr:hypothetical protein [Baekduia sp.]